MLMKSLCKQTKKIYIISHKLLNTTFQNNSYTVIHLN